MKTSLDIIYPGEKHEDNYRPDWLFGMELDRYYPDLKLGFEHQGQQHYSWPNMFHKTIEEFINQRKRDIRKMEICIERGILLFCISSTPTVKHIRRLLTMAKRNQGTDK